MKFYLNFLFVSGVIPIQKGNFVIEMLMEGEILRALQYSAFD